MTEYRHSRLVESVTHAAGKRNAFPDFEAHLRELGRAGWTLHTMTATEAGGYQVLYDFIWMRDPEHSSPPAS